jgi:hypothetical protein
MDQRTFESLMKRAGMARSAGAADADFLAGYVRGLRRAYHGEQSGSDAEHALWSSLEGDPMRKRQAAGYRAGLGAVPISFEK